MRTLFKTGDVIKFLHNFSCSMTANDISAKADGAEFIDAKYVRSFLIDEIYYALIETINQHTYKS